MLSLPNVTLCTAFDNCHELHLLAADECLKRVKFGDVKIFSDDARGRDYITHVEKFGSGEAYKRFFHYQMPALIETSHILYFQWDSWIINPEAWTDELIEYDYVGAPWWYGDGCNVGNSGFCIRSKRLMEFIASHEEEFPIVHPEDATLCRKYQSQLPQFKWAPQDLAWRFAFERTSKYAPTHVFGFHGLFNLPLVLSIQDLGARLRLASVEPYITTKPEWAELGLLTSTAGLSPNEAASFSDNSIAKTVQVISADRRILPVIGNIYRG